MKTRLAITSALGLLIVLSHGAPTTAAAEDDVPLARLIDQPWHPKAPPLPKPAGQIIRVATVDELYRAADAVRPGGTILLADGHYLMPRYFELRIDNVSLRSETGRRDGVVLDGKESRHDELVGVTRCSGVTIADLTIQNVRANGFKINSDLAATRVTIRNCVIRNVWQRGVKGPAVRAADLDRIRPSDCRIEFCLFFNDRPKQFDDDPTDTAKTFDGNYVGGIDAMHARRWTICDNVFVGIQGRTREARGAVFLWNEAEECVVERNVIIDCDSGICLGNGHKPPDVEAHARRCTVRNNFLTRCPEQGILAQYTRDCTIVHNTVHDPASRRRRLLRLVDENDGLTVANNFLSGPQITVETKSQIRLIGNVNREATPAFTNPAAGDLHLKRRETGVTGAAHPSAAPPTDVDGQARDAKPDVGADEATEKPG